MHESSPLPPNPSMFPRQVWGWITCLRLAHDDKITSIPLCCNAFTAPYFWQETQNLTLQRPRDCRISSSMAPRKNRNEPPAAKFERLVTSTSRPSLQESGLPTIQTQGRAVCSWHAKLPTSKADGVYDFVGNEAQALQATIPVSAAIQTEAKQQSWQPLGRG